MTSLFPPRVTAMVIPTLADFGVVDLMLPAGLLLILAGLVMWSRKRRQVTQQSNRTAREQFHSMKEEKAVRGDLEQIMVEIEQLAKRMSAQLDSKSMRLERLLQEADSKIAELERRHRQLDSTTPPTARSAPPSLSALASDASTPDPAAEPMDATDEQALAHSVHKLADAGMTPLEIARHLNEHQGKIELVLALRQGDA